MEVENKYKIVVDCLIEEGLTRLKVLNRIQTKLKECNREIIGLENTSESLLKKVLKVGRENPYYFILVKDSIEIGTVEVDVSWNGKEEIKEKFNFLTDDYKVNWLVCDYYMDDVVVILNVPKNGNLKYGRNLVSAVAGVQKCLELI